MVKSAAVENFCRLRFQLQNFVTLKLVFILCSNLCFFIPHKCVFMFINGEKILRGWVAMIDDLCGFEIDWPTSLYEPPGSSRHFVIQIKSPKL